ncbi:hypothetical protein BJ508DRAFT_412300 [Ascobolus immersus RN42]|uniref:Uncharacterized protein n=1 Tax=Ascobolus immersus RN42 TaxID=1160509 RepID=A0A3N4IGC0_ASCIM|nr:hypothetical protein BJ508DRAFT_412300 [Ascobolus immersus RN42]
MGYKTIFRSVYTTTSTIKRIQVSTTTDYGEVTQYTPPADATCGNRGHYIPYPPDPDDVITRYYDGKHIYPDDDYSLYGFTGRKTFLTVDDRQCIHTGLPPRIYLTNTGPLETLALQNGRGHAYAQLCPRYYTYATITMADGYDTVTMTDSYSTVTTTTARVATAEKTPVASSTMSWQRASRITGKCCPYNPTATWSLTAAAFGDLCQTVSAGTTTKALPIHVSWFQKTRPIASSYDSEHSNYEFAFYTSWPLSTKTEEYWWVDQPMTGLVIAEILKPEDDPDPTNTKMATMYPEPERVLILDPFEKGMIALSVVGFIALVAVFWFLRRIRKRKAAERERRLDEGLRAAAGEEPPESIDPTPTYSANPKGGEILLERMPVEGDLSYGGRSDERMDSTAVLVESERIQSGRNVGVGELAPPYSER